MSAIARTRPYHAASTATPRAVDLASAPGLNPWANLSHTARDGTRLVVDAHLPPAARWPVPVVITRTAYGRSKHLAEGRGWRQLGYGYVVADVRGRYDSEGTWSPYRNERADGAALVEWVLAQPWCDGRLIAYGGSYSGYTAWAMAAQRPDAVRAVVSLGPSMSLTGTKLDPSGILRLAEHAAWWLERAESRTSRDGLTRQVFAEQPQLLHHLPVAELAELLGADLPHWSDILPRPSASTGQTDQASDDPFTAGEPVTDQELSQLRCASLHVGGWYDLLLPQTLQMYDTVGRAHTPRAARSLLIGPWEHDLAFAATTAVGAREHGPTSRVDFGAILTDWLGEVLGEPSEPDSGTQSTSASRSASRPTREQVFLLGANRWLDAHQRAQPRRELMFGAAASDHLIPIPDPDPVSHQQSHAPRDDTDDTGGTPGGVATFSYDPLNPSLTYPPAVDRSPTLARSDAVRFRTAVLAQPLTIAGAPRVILHATSDAPTVDWTARLLEHCADGTLLEFTRGTALAAGPIREHRITLLECAVQLAAGSRLVLEITTSDFPYLSRNLNTDADRYRSADTRVATQSVFHGPAATHVSLPAVVVS